MKRFGLHFDVLRINCTLRNGNSRIDRIGFPQLGVLIVPCGMETRFALLGDKIAWCINCTLRNGNLYCYPVPFGYIRVLIVPCGMETAF